MYLPTNCSWKGAYACQIPPSCPSDYANVGGICYNVKERSDLTAQHNYNGVQAWAESALKKCNDDGAGLARSMTYEEGQSMVDYYMPVIYFDTKNNFTYITFKFDHKK